MQFSALIFTIATLTLQQNLYNGSQLELSDGSIYEIAPTDREKTTFWLTPISMKITEDSGDPLFPLLITNTATGVSVKARKLARVGMELK